jgi:hypothetical protein
LLVPSSREYNSSKICHKVHACVSSMIWFKTLSLTHYRINPQACRWSTSHWFHHVTGHLSGEHSLPGIPLHIANHSFCSFKLDNLYHSMISFCWYLLPSLP